MHFSTHKDWNREAIDKFIDWFKKYDFGPFEETELLQLGDVVEKASNLGDTLELVTLFFDIACTKFKSIYVLGGNHCHKLVNEKSQYATQYLKMLGDEHQIKTIFKEEIFKTENGVEIIALPYRRVNGKILDDYYSNDLPDRFYTTKADLICGHVAIKEKGSFYGGIDLTKFPLATHHAFGHIHVRSGQYKQSYTGSIMPFKIDEEHGDLQRCVKTLEKNAAGIKLSEILIPKFVTYENVNFGDAPAFKKNSDDLVHIYTVTNCKNAQQAKNYYGDYYIRGVEKIMNNTSVMADMKEDLFMTPLIALDSMIKETKMIIKRKTLFLLKDLLK
jgi:DNA repair exonuclease SbcCD nuclease subunit